ncbi:ATP-binding cassette domain-containing protein [Angustibacter sp. Root456]|uniref:ATP-binding cassette domain-containing protein n=1 Tax=Angustibacter sp. Root456 TaxID=1736539 RepID=UPI0007153E24|nr:ATP-binding cassette domain-containing protein [Angustibacter sp. Root456]KQX69808.1 sugar ABC transporter ATP-binding protein [Angustibacter sp. Root456]
MEAQPSGQAVLELVDIRKSYGAVQALRGASLKLRAGEVHALVGDNGAGKSTLIKTIAGVQAFDQGQILWKGEPVALNGPRDAAKLGISVVYQDLAVCGNLSVSDNVFLGGESMSKGPLGSLLRRIDRRAMEQETLGLLKSLSVNLQKVRSPVEGLSGGQRQSVAIARALLGRPEVMLLDEPTAALSVAQTAEVLNLVRRLRDQGLAVIIVSHNLADVFAVSDVVTVLRLGQIAGRFEVASSSQQEVVAAITGAEWGVVS